MKTQTPFKAELESNIIKTIRKLKREGITGMGLENLRKVTPSPKMMDGAPLGTNSRYYYAEIFKEVCESNAFICRFIDPVTR
jgi:hypothetical protein